MNCETFPFPYRNRVNALGRREAGDGHLIERQQGQKKSHNTLAIRIAARPANNFSEYHQ